MGKRRGVSYKKRVREINRIYDREAKRGVPNREIWRRYIYPAYGISERTYYNILKAEADPKNELPREQRQMLSLFDFDDEGNYKDKEDDEER